MSTKRPSRDFWLGQLIMWFTMFFILFLVVSIANSQKDAERGDYGFSEASLPMIQGNTIVAITAPYIPTKVLGSIIEDVIECESGWQHIDKYGNVIRGDAGEYGICQFMPDTWAHFNEIRGTNLDILNEEHQLDMIDWAFEKGYQEHWTCYRNLTK